MPPETFALRIQRTFAAPRERVFRSFTDPALRSQWLRPADDWTVPVSELEPRVGGRYRDVFRSPDGVEFSESGELRELRRLARLVLEQSGYRERRNRDEQQQGWPAFLDQLAKLLARS